MPGTQNVRLLCIFPFAQSMAARVQLIPRLPFHRSERAAGCELTRRRPLPASLCLVLPGAAFSFSLSSFFSCRTATSAVRIPSLSFSRSCLSFRYRLASSSARVFPYLPYWLESEPGCQERRAEVKGQMCRGCGKTAAERRAAIFLPAALSRDRRRNQNRRKSFFSH